MSGSVSGIPADLAVAILRELRNLREDVESKFGLDWTDVGFTGDEEARENRKKPRFSKDVQLVALTDPTSDPMSIVSPASSALEDPILRMGNDSVDLHATLANKTTPVFKALHGFFIAGTAARRFMTLEQPAGTDYQVPAGKQLLYTSWFGQSQAVAANDTMALGYADDAVAEGTVDATGTIYVFGRILDSAETTGIISLKTAGKPETFKIWGVVPSSKYPIAVRSPAAATQWSFNVFGIEIDN